MALYQKWVWPILFEFSLKYNVKYNNMAYLYHVFFIWLIVWGISRSVPIKINRLTSGKLIINLKLSMNQWFYNTYWNIAVLVTIIRHWMLSVSGVNQAWHVWYKNVLIASLYLQSLCILLSGKPHPLPCMISWFIIWFVLRLKGFHWLSLKSVH